VVLVLVLCWGLTGLARCPPADQAGAKVIACDHPKLLFAPYVWKRIETDSTFGLEATMPGAYLKAAVEGTASIGIVIDGSANNGCPASSMPVVEYSLEPWTLQSRPTV